MRQEEIELATRLSSGQWNLARLLLENVEVTGGFRLDLTLELVGRNTPSTRVVVLFTGVRELRVEQWSSNLAVAPEIVSIEDRGWEDLRLKFRDHGDGLLSFFCVEMAQG